MKKIAVYTKDVESLVREVESSGWFDWQHAVWLLAFVVKLVRTAATARRHTPRGKQAASVLAWHLGQLVDDPLFLRQDEETEQESKRQRYEVALVNHMLFGATLHDHWSKESSAKSIEGAFCDAKLMNSFARQFIDLFGVTEQVKQSFPALHTSCDEGSDPLFTEEAWPRWWKWAQAEFFATNDSGAVA